MKRVLVVEDEAIMAYDLADHLTAAGFECVGPALDVEQGLALLNREGCDLAVLDVNLGQGKTSESIALDLRRRAIPFVVVSGYAREQHPPAFIGSPIVLKPVRFDLLLAELNKLELVSPRRRRGVKPAG